MVDVRHLDRGQLAQLAHDFLDQATEVEGNTVEEVPRSVLATAGVGYALLAGLAPRVEIVDSDTAFAQRFAESAADGVPPDDVPEQTPALSSAGRASRSATDLRYLLVELNTVTDHERAKLRRAVDVLDQLLAGGRA